MQYLYFFFVHFSWYRDLAGGSGYRAGISGGVSGESEEPPHAAFDLCRDGAHETGGGYNARVSDSVSAGKHPVVGCGAGNALAFGPHHGDGRLPAVL